MIVRKIKPEEFKRTEELFAIAFGYSYDCDKSPMEVYNEKMADPNARESVKIFDKYAAFEDDDKIMMSCLSAIHFAVNFNGKEVVMAGIGDVSSVPTYRRRGGIRGCFTKMLPDLYEADVAFSYLYPFSTFFYNKFGYGMGVKGNMYELDLSRIPRYGTTGKTVLIEPENAQELLEDVAAVYRVWQQKYNGMVMNGPLEYQFVTNANPCKKLEFVYLYRSAAGTPKGYISFHKEECDGNRILVCNKIVFVDGEGLRGLLELVATYAADYWKIRFTVPEDVEVESVLRELALGACRLNHAYTGMVRVINVEKALRLSSYHGTGRIAIQVIDPYIDENNGIFTVIYQEGEAVEIHRKPVTGEEKAVDAICMHIDHFSEFIFQNRPVTNFLYYEGEQQLTEDEINMLEQTFARRTSFLMEFF